MAESVVIGLLLAAHVVNETPTPLSEFKLRKTPQHLYTQWYDFLRLQKHISLMLSFTPYRCGMGVSQCRRAFRYPVSCWAVRRETAILAALMPALPRSYFIDKHLELLHVCTGLENTWLTLTQHWRNKPGGSSYHHYVMPAQGESFSSLPSSFLLAHWSGFCAFQCPELRHDGVLLLFNTQWAFMCISLGPNVVLILASQPQYLNHIWTVISMQQQHVWNLRWNCIIFTHWMS